MSKTTILDKEKQCGIYKLMTRFYQLPINISVIVWLNVKEFREKWLLYLLTL